MKTLTITEIAKRHTVLREALEEGSVRITWKEAKPNGEVIFSAIVKKEDRKNGITNNRKRPKV